MCGRATTDVSDLWVLRYIWDTLEQVEILARIVDEVVNSGLGDSAEDDQQLQRHPRSQGADAPNAEDVSRDVDQLENQLTTATGDRAKLSWICDRLSILVARVEWIQNEVSRDHLRQKIQQLLSSANELRHHD